jgi:hypothetical protein
LCPNANSPPRAFTMRFSAAICNCAVSYAPIKFCFSQHAYTLTPGHGRLCRIPASKLANVNTVPTSSSEILPPDVASFVFITLIASFLCLSFSTCKPLSPLTSIPYNAQFARVACSRPASLSTKNLHVCLASIATELFVDALLSTNINC